MPRFHVAHRKDGKFERRGLRNYFEYRDLGIKRATKGAVVAHVIRAGIWLRNHPEKPRPHGTQFLVGWMTHEQDKPRSPGNGDVVPLRAAEPKHPIDDRSGYENVEIRPLTEEEHAYGMDALEGIIGMLKGTGSHG